MSKKLLPALVPIRSVLFILVFIFGSLLVGKDLDEISSWWSIVATLINILTIAVLVCAARKNGMTYGQLINYRKGTTKIKTIVILSALIIILGMGCMYLAGFICYGKFPYLAPMMIEPIPAVLAIINIPLLPVTTALAEDGLYLGCGVNRIENKTAAVLYPAFFFALQHCFIPTLFDGRYILYRFLSFLPLTIILCRYYYVKRDPLPIMIGHALIDCATVFWIFATSVIPGYYDKLNSMI